MLPSVGPVSVPVPAFQVHDLSGEMTSDVVLSGPASKLPSSLLPALYHVASQTSTCLSQHLSKVTSQVHSHLSQPGDTQTGLTLHH